MIGWEPIDAVGERMPVFFRLRMVRVCIGHLRLMHDIGIDIESGMTGEDVLVAAFICSGSHQERRKDLNRWWARMFFSLWGRSCGRIAIRAESEAFSDWLMKQLRGPITKSKSDTPHESSAPMHQNLIACCCGMLGMKMSEALDTTVREARQLICAYGEARGEMELWTRNDEARRELSVKLGLVEARKD